MVYGTTHARLTYSAPLKASMNLREIQLFIANLYNYWRIVNRPAVACEIGLHAEKLRITTRFKSNNNNRSMEHRTKELTRAHGVHTALKVKDSKTGKVILKDNVFEDSKLECEINHLKLWQKKEESRLRWEKEYAIRDMRKHLVRRVNLTLKY